MHAKSFIQKLVLNAQVISALNINIHEIRRLEDSSFSWVVH